MKRLASFLGVIAVTALVTYLLIADRFRREQVDTLRRELAQAQSNLARLQEDFSQAQHELTARNSPRLPFEPRTTNAASHRATAKASPVAASVAEQNGSVVQNQVAAAGGIPPIPSVVPAGGWVAYDAFTGSSCRVHGTTRNGRRWALEGKVIGGSLDLDSRLWAGALAATNLSVIESNFAARAELVIPIRSLRSQLAPGGPRMDQQVQAVMEASKYPRITFRLDQLAIRSRTNSAEPSLYCQGTLDIHGRTNRIDFPISLAKIRVNQVMAIGATAIRMSDYGIIPPLVPLPGEPDVVEDDVAISFEWVGQQSKRSPPGLTENAP